MYNSQFIYILAGNREAIELFNLSKETLIKSSNFGFEVFKVIELDALLDELEAWEEFVIIDKPTYASLYSNLCLKFRDLLVPQSKVK